MEPLFPPATTPLVPIIGKDQGFPIHRIFCVGRNYAAHAAEMGFEVDREAPWYFTKAAHHYQPSGGTIPSPAGTQNFHYEMELAVAIGQAGKDVPVSDALNLVYGYACALDMTRRDLQIASRDKGRPWDLGKDTENSAVIAPITPLEAFGPLDGQRITLAVDGEIRQDATLDEMIWGVPEIISHLSGFYTLQRGDLILTGTPSGVGPVYPGETIIGQVEGLTDITLTIAL